MLSEGIRKNEETLKAQGIHLSPGKLEALCGELERAAHEQEDAENRLKEARNKAHDLLTALKNLYNESKMPIKSSYEMEAWAKFGIMDKR